MLKKAVLCIGVVSLAVAAAVVLAQQPPGGRRPGGGGRGMMGDMMYLERTWTAVSFQLDCTSEQLASLRPTYRNALNARNAALAKAREAGDFEAMGKAIRDCKTRLEAKLKEVLSTQQMTKLQQLMQPPRRPGRPGGGR
ncbi:MAG: hypothetical protein ACE5R4_08100 [Armatimonadota bacterium]